MFKCPRAHTPLTGPGKVCRQAGFEHGDEVEFMKSDGIINIVPKLPTANAEYTPEQRSVVDARLAEGLLTGDTISDHAPKSTSKIDRWRIHRSIDICSTAQNEDHARARLRSTESESAL